ncbi:MAG: mechanosensitive ion channel domain-containing protein [Sneathiella sp.]|uniref:mechanosensitive ion channel family protein n=1 Tax=Sneathiella sp. TaxID=1964365 RepID=UPI003002FAE7
MTVLVWIGRNMVTWALSVLLLLTLNSSVVAQTQPEPTELRVISADLSETEFQAMLGRLSDEQVRDILIDEFAARRAAEPVAKAGLLANADTIIATLSSNAQSLWAKWPEFGAAFSAVNNRLAAAGGLSKALLALVISGVAGLAVRFFWRRKAAKRQLALAERNIDKGPYATLGTIGDAGLFLLIELSSVVAFAVSAMAALYLLFHNVDLRVFVSYYVAVLTVVLVVWSFVESMFPRNWPIYRLVAISDNATRLLHWVILGSAGLWMFEANTSALMSRFGAPEGTPHLFSFSVSILWIAMAQIGIYFIHRATSDLLPRREDTGFVNMITRNWAVLMGFWMFAVWILFAGGSLLNSDIDVVAGLILKMQLVLLGFWTAYRVLLHYLRAQDLSVEMESAISRTARAVLFAACLITVFAIWGLDPATLQAGGPAEQWIQAAINVGLTALIGWAIWDFISTLIDTRIAAELPETNGDEGGEAEGGLGASRTATLLPLLRSTAVATIAVICLFAALSSLGVNVAPLVAGAGVLGLAIGFGAQTLVKDIVSGVFFLIDDAFRRGEYIDLGSVKGTVERISVRSLQLRHHLGAVHTIPFGDISALTNYSRDWVIMKLPLRLTFDTDPQKVKKIIKQLGAELMADEILGDGLLSPPKSQGVIQMEDSAMILRVKFTAIPGKQFTIRRELLHRIRAAFEEAGIRFANREVTVRVSEDASPSERQKAAGAAASRALETEPPAT